MEIFKDIENSGLLVISLSADCSIEKTCFNFYLPVVVWHSDCSGHNFNYFQYLMLHVDLHPFSSYLKFVACPGAGQEWWHRVDRLQLMASLATRSAIVLVFTESSLDNKIAVVVLIRASGIIWEHHNSLHKLL